MNRYIERLPKKYRDSIRAFYQDDDGWWITLDSNGLYDFVGYASEYTIHEDTQLEAIAQFRRCIHRKEGERLYLAYGSNLNLSQMKYRCPGAKLLGYTYLDNYRLIFRGSGTGNYLSIEPKFGSKVPCGVFSITAEDERNLDQYEGFPRFYRKAEIKTFLHAKNGNSRTISAMYYYLPEQAEAGLPTTRYLMTCKQGYEDVGFNKEALIRAMNDTMEEIL